MAPTGWPENSEHCGLPSVTPVSSTVSILLPPRCSIKSRPLKNQPQLSKHPEGLAIPHPASGGLMPGDCCLECPSSSSPGEELLTTLTGPAQLCPLLGGACAALRPVPRPGPCSCEESHLCLEAALPAPELVARELSVPMVEPQMPLPRSPLLLVPSKVLWRFMDLRRC